MAAGIPDIPMPQGFLGVLGPAETTALIVARDTPPEEAPATPESALLGYLKGVWQAHKDAKEQSGVEDQMVENLRALAGEYDATTQAALTKIGAPDLFLSISELKARHAVSWLLDIFSNEEDKPWGLRPSPVPELPPGDAERIQQEIWRMAQQAVQQGQQAPSPQELARVQEEAVRDEERAVVKAATDRVSRCERKILDQLNRGGWADVFEDFIKDLVELKAGIAKGPVVRMVKQRTWVIGPEGRPVVQYVEKPALTFDRVSPFDAYPAPDAVDFKADFIERQRLARHALDGLRNVDGFDVEAIDAALLEFDSLKGASWLPVDENRQNLEERASEARTKQSTVEALEYWLTVTGAQLKEFGWLTLPDGGLIEDARPYSVVALTVGDHILHFGLNPDPLGRKPYSKNGWASVNGSFWYRGLPELLAPVQRVLNASVRALTFNMGLASGPQIVIPDINRFPADESLTDLFPARVWQGHNPGNSTQPLVQFQSVDLRAGELLQVFERFTNLADDYSGVPAYAYGDDRGSNSSRTSSGLSMLMTSAARGIKRVVLSTDKRVFRDMITRVYDWNIQNEEDPMFQGDAEVVATGAVAIMVKEQMAERRIAFLAQTNNPVDQQIMGAEGRGVLLRESAKTLELAGQKVVKDEEDLRKWEQELSENARRRSEAEAAEAQAKIQIEQEKVQLDRIRIEGDLEVKRAALALKERELLTVKASDAATRAAAAAGKAGEADRKAREKGEPAPSDVDALVNELGLDQTPAVEPEEEMVNELVTDGAEFGAPGGDVVGGPEVPSPPGMVEGEPGGPPGVV